MKALEMRPTAKQKTRLLGGHSYCPHGLVHVELSTWKTDIENARSYRSEEGDIGSAGENLSTAFYLQVYKNRPPGRQDPAVTAL